MEIFEFLGIRCFDSMVLSEKGGEKGEGCAPCSRFFHKARAFSVVVVTSSVRFQFSLILFVLRRHRRQILSALVKSCKVNVIVVV